MGDGEGEKGKFGDVDGKEWGRGRKEWEVRRGMVLKER